MQLSDILQLVFFDAITVTVGTVISSELFEQEVLFAIANRAQYKMAYTVMSL